MKKLHPLTLIRRELAKDPAWAKYSTHAGFAELVGRSRSGVKNIEYGIVDTSTAFAQRVGDRLGIDTTWLTAPLPATLPIPAAGDGEWNADMIPSRLKSALEGNNQILSKNLVVLREIDKTGSSANPQNLLAGLADLPENQEFLADVLARHVRDRLVQEFRGGKPEPFITRLRQLLETADHDDSR